MWDPTESITSASTLDDEMLRMMDMVDNFVISISELPSNAIVRPVARVAASNLRSEVLKVIDFEKSDADDCVVCLEKLFDEEHKQVVKEMPCGHRYHGKCIGQWLNMHNSCPLCRYEMPRENRNEEAREVEEGMEIEDILIGFFDD